MLDSRLGPSPLTSLYMPVGSEMDPLPIAEALRERDTRLCLPVVVEQDAPLVFRLWTPGDPLAPDLMGTPAPLATARAIDPELVLVPLLAFDAEGGRLGQGGGYFDRTIADLQTRTKAVIVGLGYAGQEVPSLPVEAHDRPLDAVLTEQGFRLFTRGPQCA